MSGGLVEEFLCLVTKDVYACFRVFSRMPYCL
jgi:hypothetical protein